MGIPTSSLHFSALICKGLKVQGVNSELKADKTHVLCHPRVLRQTSQAISGKDITMLE